VSARKGLVLSIIALTLATSSAPACRPDWISYFTTVSELSPDRYSWRKLTNEAGFPGGYNFPLFNFRNTLWVLRSEGNWFSKDGKNWTKSELPPSGLNTGYQQYVQFKDSIYALGGMEGNYLNLKLDSRIMRTSDLKRWEVIAAKSELPARVFYGATVSAGKIWLIGGFDGARYYNDVWNSGDGVKWNRVAEHCAWAERCNPSALAFDGKMWLIGGGIIDRQNYNDAWYSADGINWKQASDKIASQPVFGYSAIAFDGKMWLVGANRNGLFKSAMLVSSDGENWKEEDAPWSPRGGVATCVYDERLFMTGGKYSVTENGNIKFIYNNDVWSMARSNQ